MPRSPMLTFVAAALAFAGAAAAQNNPAKDSPLEANTASPADKPLTIAQPPLAADSDTARPLALLFGSFTSEAQGDRPALRLNAAPITVDGLSGCVLFELSRADAPADPFRVAIIHIYKRRGELRFRIFDIVDLFGDDSLKKSLVGAWGAPQTATRLSTANLIPNLDIPLETDGAGYTGATTQPVPTIRDGAIEMTSRIAFTPESISITDAGFDVTGKRVWGQDNDHPVVFNRLAKAPDVTRTLDGGLIITTLVPPAPDASAVVEGGEIAVQYTGWLTDGTRFDTSRQPGREPFRLRLPGGVIKGWNDGLRGIAKGERRRLYIPAPLAYADKGAARGLIPPNSALIFEVECVHVDNSAVQPPAPRNGEDDKPLGKPATNSAPETPR